MQFYDDNLDQLRFAKQLKLVLALQADILPTFSFFHFSFSIFETASLRSLGCTYSSEMDNLYKHNDLAPR